MAYQELLDPEQPEQLSGPPPEPMGMQAVTQPNPVAHLNTPPATPAELEKRKAGWAAVWEKFQTDPNLQRAFSMAGAMLAQPKQPGQTNAGNISNAYMVGTNAYQQGEAAQLKQKLAMSKEEREAAESKGRVAESAVRVPNIQAQTAGTQASTAGTQQQTAQRTEMQPSVVARSGSEAATAATGVLQADENLAHSRENHPIERARGAAQTVDAMAQARERDAKAAVSEEQLRALQALSPQERSDYLLKKGAHKENQTAFSQQVAEFGAAYDRKTPEQQATLGSRDDYIETRMGTGKAKSALERYAAYQTLVDRAPDAKDENIEKALKKEVLDSMRSPTKARGSDYKPGDKTGPEMDAEEAAAKAKAAAAPPKPAAKRVPKAPKPGEVRQGYRFKGPEGADPADPNNWEKS